MTITLDSVNDSIQEYYDSLQEIESSITLMLEDILTNDFRLVSVGFKDDLFTFKVNSEEIYEVEEERLSWIGFELKGFRAYTNTIQYTFIEEEI